MEEFVRKIVHENVHNFKLKQTRYINMKQMILTMVLTIAGIFFVQDAQAVKGIYPDGNPWGYKCEKQADGSYKCTVKSKGGGGMTIQAACSNVQTEKGIRRICCNATTCWEILH